MCLEPTQEDHDWFPHIAGNGDWLGVLKDAWANYRDESFVAQFLSPKVIRDMKLFSIMDDSNDDSYYVSDIHDERGYRRVRKHLSEMYDIGLNTPDVQVVDMDPKTRQLLLVHNSRNGLHLEPNNGAAVNDLVERLWGFEVLIEERKIPTPAVEGTIFEAWD
jgi:spore cortex formation protein SpoVR/YcgB (stage V sporulation)